jgi:hypothetical protein
MIDTPKVGSSAVFVVHSKDEATTGSSISKSNMTTNWLVVLSWHQNITSLLTKE